MCERLQRFLNSKRDDGTILYNCTQISKVRDKYPSSCGIIKIRWLLIVIIGTLFIDETQLLILSTTNFYSVSTNP